MNTEGDIIIIEDDNDDRELLVEFFEETLAKLGHTNKVISFERPVEALEYVQNMTQKPFLMISDLNMPVMTGFQLREKIQDDPRLEQLCVPYIFLTTNGYNKEIVKEAYKLSVQGYFKKPDNPAEYLQIIEEWIRYWKRAITT